MKAVLILSGGLDSTTLLYKLLADGYQVEAITFDYGQRHRREIDSARKIAAINGVPHRVVDLSAITPLLGDSALLGGKDIPSCHYTEDAAKQTVVPNRNMIMLSIAVGYAEAMKISEVYYAAHAGDWAIYPDCRSSFIEAMASAIRLATAWNPVELKAPFVGMTKAEIVKLGLTLNVPYELTWSCYQGGDKPCGVCPTCIERAEAFAVNRVDDPYNCL
ncbi:MAG TPA: 7-cyano-7-deazaguanine synthase QueC [Methanotrichaceae archaeon]|nr:7-cyano-7-deazaguanine synthase QueC [Methanotrichaceae archaeon]